MRYLRDLGVDAYLILYSDDGRGSLSHFTPENDTWDIEKWSKYIIQSEFPNGKKGALKYIFKRNRIKKFFDQFDILLGNGFAPAYMAMIGRSLDVFLPYAIRGEFLHYMRSSNPVNNLSRALQSKLQIEGLRRTKFICGVFDKMGYKFVENNFRIQSYSIPMLYLENSDQVVSERISTLVEMIDSFKFVVFSHLSHGWKTKGKKTDIKRNDVLIKGFAKFVNEHKISDAKLIFVEYGFDVDESKKLISESGIYDYVVWLPKMTRKEILCLLKHVDLGGNGMHGSYWGGSGWEFLASGVPMMHNISDELLEAENIKSWPPFFNTRTTKQISESLYYAYLHPQEMQKMGANCKDWFDAEQGLALAKKYKDLIECIVNNQLPNGVVCNYDYISNRNDG